MKKPTKIQFDSVEEEIMHIITTYNSKSFVGMFNRRPKLLEFINEYYDQYPNMELMERLYCFKHDTLPPQCPYCQQQRIFNTFVKGHWGTCGSVSCRYKSQSSSLSQYAKDNPDKIKQQIENGRKTLLEKYGTTNPMLVPGADEKLRKTMIERYGVEYSMHSPEIRAKMEETNLERYGSTTPFGSEEVQRKVQETHIKRYGKLMVNARKARDIMFNGKNTFSDEKVREKTRLHFQEKYGCDHPKQIHYTKEQYELLNNEKLFMEFVEGKNT